MQTAASLAGTDRRNLLKWAAVMAGTGAAGSTAHAATAAAPTSPASRPAAGAGNQPVGSGSLGRGLVGFMLAHEQFPVPELVSLGTEASRAGFRLLATSDHLQPWQDNEGHSGSAWVTFGALGGHATSSWMGTTVTCPTFRYNPAVVAEAFASLSLLYPGRIFLGVGSGEALNEQVATGEWPNWQERWNRLIEAMSIIRALWRGDQINHEGQYYHVTARLYDPPAKPIPLLTAANGKKSMRLAGQYGDGLITDPLTWQKHKPEWQAGAKAAGKDPDAMPVLVEQYVVVGDQATAQKAAELWRFGPKAFKTLYNVPSPVRIQQLAQQTPLDQVMEGWPVGTDPEPHIRKLKELFDSGVSIVNVHAGQPDPRTVIEFYGRHVLPHFQQPEVAERG